MPSSATITSFFSFTAGTKARANQVNTNFDNLRGHLIPTNVNTASAVDATWDMGSTDYQWRNVYFSGSLLQGGQPFAGSQHIPVLFPGTSSPVKLPSQGSLPRLKFSANNKDCRFEIPALNYGVGTQIKLILRGYFDTSVTGADTSSRWRAETSLYRPGVDVAGTTAATNVHTSTVDITHSSGGSFQLFSNNSLTMTDATGLINSATVTTDAVLGVSLKRLGGATEDTYGGNVIINTVLVSFG